MSKLFTYRSPTSDKVYPATLAVKEDFEFFLYEVMNCESPFDLDIVEVAPHTKDYEEYCIVMFKDHAAAIRYLEARR